MRISKLQLAGLLVGAVLLGGVASVGAQEESPPSAEEGERPHRGKRGGLHGPRGAIRSEAVVPGSEEGTFRTIRTDRGTLAAVEDRTLVIDEADGETVRVPIADDTRIRRDGEEASFEDLEVGDHVIVLRAREGDGILATEAVKAVTAERLEELEQRRARIEACREDPEDEGCEPPHRGPHASSSVWGR